MLSLHFSFIIPLIADIDCFPFIIRQPRGRCFLVHKPKDFVKRVIPAFFRMSKLTSFQRQLNLYGFVRLTTGRNRGAYYHELFLRHRLFLCERIERIIVKGNGVKGKPSPASEPDFYSMTEVTTDTNAVEVNRRLGKTVEKNLAKSFRPTSDVGLKSGVAANSTAQGLSSDIISLPKPEPKKGSEDNIAFATPSFPHSTLQNSVEHHTTLSPISLAAASQKEEEYESCQHQLRGQGQVTHYWSNCIRDTQDVIAQAADVIASAKSFLRSLREEKARCQQSDAQAALFSTTQVMNPSLYHTFSFNVRSNMSINMPNLSPCSLSPPT